VFNTAVSDLRGCICQIPTGVGQCFVKVTVQLIRTKYFFSQFSALWLRGHATLRKAQFSYLTYLLQEISRSGRFLTPGHRKLQTLVLKCLTALAAE